MRVVTVCIASVFLIFIAAPVQAAHTIEFPEESIGTVSIQPDATTDFKYETFASYRSGWQRLGPAAGSVAIPDGHAVRLELNQAAPHHTEWMSSVPVELIDAIEASGVPLGDDWFGQLSQLSGLRALSLANTDLTSGIAVHLLKWTLPS